MPQQPSNQSEHDQPAKPGPHEKLHSLYPLTFKEAVERALQYKPVKPETQSQPLPASKTKRKR